MNDWSAKLGIEEELKTSEQAEVVNETVVDANFSSDEVAKIAKDSLDFLAGLAIPTVFRFLFPPVLQAAWQLLRKYVDEINNEHRLALGIPRGHGKTTLIKLFVLYCILFTKVRFILVLSETGPKAENIISDIVDMLNEPNIIKVFGDWKIGIEKDTLNLKKFGFRGRNITIAAIGAGGSLRGLNIKNERPDLMLFDDIQSQECAESQTQSDALLKWMIGTAMKAKSPHGCLMIYTGNMFAGPNSILKKLKKNPQWVKFISGAILADGSVLWPELRNFDSLIAELDNDINMGHPEIFFSEVMNDTEIVINQRVDLTKIKPWPWSEQELPQGKFIIIDPSTGKKGRDPVSIGYVEVYDRIPALREVIEEQLSPGNTILKTLLLALKTGTRLIACEGTAYQSTLLYWFNEKVKQFGITGLEFVEVNTHSISKNSRIIDALKALSVGEIILHDAVKDRVVHQIVNWNPLRRDNNDGILDLLAYFYQVLDNYEYAIATDTHLSLVEVEDAKVVEGQWSF